MEDFVTMHFWSSVTWLVIMAAAVVAARMWDFMLSRDGMFYGLHEGKPWQADKYQIFSPKRHLMFTAIWIAGWCVVYIFWKDAWVALALFAAGHAGYCPFLMGKKKKQRDRQIDFINHAKATILAGQELSLAMESRYDRRCISMFNYIFNFIADGDASRLDLSNRFRDMALGAESEWFKIPPPFVPKAIAEPPLEPVGIRSFRAAVLDAPPNVRWIGEEEFKKEWERRKL